MTKDTMSSLSVNGLIERVSKKEGKIMASNFLLACLINKNEVSVFDKTDFIRKPFNLIMSDQNIWVCDE